MRIFLALLCLAAASLLYLRQQRNAEAARAQREFAAANAAAEERKQKARRDAENAALEARRQIIAESALIVDAIVASDALGDSPRSFEQIGSAFFARLRGKRFIVTNAHVLSGNVAVRFIDLSGRRIVGGRGWLAVDHDIAIIEVTDDGPALEVMKQPHAHVRAGQTLVVYGNSAGGGVITQTDGALVAWGPQRIEHSANTVPGNSGSPLIDASSGEVLGVVSYLTTPRVFANLRGHLGSRYETAYRQFAFRLDTVTTWEEIDPGVSKPLWTRQQSLSVEETASFRRESSFLRDALRVRAMIQLSAALAEKAQEMSYGSLTLGSVHPLVDSVVAGFARENQRLNARSGLAAVEDRHRAANQLCDALERLTNDDVDRYLRMESGTATERCYDWHRHTVVREKEFRNVIGQQFATLRTDQALLQRLAEGR